MDINETKKSLNNFLGNPEDQEFGPTELIEAERKLKEFQELLDQLQAEIAKKEK